jgi:hypothetical protein
MSTAVTAAKTIPPVMTRRLRSPPAMMRATRPRRAPMPAATGRGISGFLRKLLNPMAPNSFSSTATQKIGREKNRNAMKVTP